MYLSKFQMDWYAARKPYDWHVLLWEGFRAQQTDDDWLDAADNLGKVTSHRRLGLFHVEDNATKAPVDIYILSERPGQQSADPRLQLVGTKPYVLNLRDGEYLEFRLRANPASLVDDPNNAGKPKRVYLSDSSEQARWLAYKLKSVATLKECNIGDHKKCRFNKNGILTTIHTALFWGSLRVDDPEVFTEVVLKGIGREKFLGCGLMLLKKLN